MRSLALVFVLAYAVVLLAWLAARTLWGDRLLMVAVINSFPTAPFVLAPLALALGVLDRRAVALVAGLVPTLIWLGIFGWRFLPRGASAQPGDVTLRVLAFNVLWSNEDVDAIAGVIGQADADLAVLPELTLTQDAALAARLGESYPYRVLSRLPSAAFGVGLYSRWPLRDLGSLATGLGLRSAVADVETPAGTVRVVGAHPRATEGTRKSLAALFERMAGSFRGRQAQVSAICGYLDAWRAGGDAAGPGGGVILAGDFNLSEFSDAYRCIGKRLGDAYMAAGWGYGFTWPGGVFEQGRLSWLRRLVLQARIDFVFYSRQWQAVDARVLRAQAGSDHWPVVTTLRLAAHGERE